MSSDTRFFDKPLPLSLRALCHDVPGLRLLRGEADHQVQDISSAQGAGPEDIILFHRPDYLSQVLSSQATVCVTSATLADRLPETMACLVADNPHRAFSLIAEKFYPNIKEDGEMPGETWLQGSQISPNIHPSSLIHPSATIAPSAHIGPYVLIGPAVVIEEGCYIASHVTLGKGTYVGLYCRIGTQVTVQYAVLGKGVVIKTGARIGQRGFGFSSGGTTIDPIPHVGRVIIGDNVEIGANTTIDRGSVGDTMIGSFTKIDNNVQIGHNVHIGSRCLIVAQVGIAGSTVIGNDCQIGGQVGIAGHLCIGSNVRIAAKSGVGQNVADHQTLAGIPAVSLMEWHGQIRALRRLKQRSKISTQQE